MRSMTETCRALLWALVACVLLTPWPSFAANDAGPLAHEVAEPTAAPKAEPKADVAPPATQPAASPSEDYRATKAIPRKLLRPLLG
jgi:hypothetical protein